MKKWLNLDEILLSKPDKLDKFCGFAILKIVNPTVFSAARVGRQFF
jgi:hypothetical protein